MARVLVQVSQNEEIGADLAPPKPEDFAKRASEIADGIAEVARDLGRQLSKALDGAQPDPLTIESLQVSFGVTVNAETSILVVKAGGQSTFTATVTWSAKR